VGYGIHGRLGKGKAAILADQQARH